MALFGRESERDRQRAQRFKQWTQARSPLALFSGLLGILALLDSFTGILGVAFGILAITTGALGLRDIRSKPALLGRRLCGFGIVLGSLGIILGVLIWVFLY